MWVQTCVHICSEVCEGVQDWRSEVDFGVLKCLCMIIFETGVLTKAETQVFHYLAGNEFWGSSFPSLPIAEVTSVHHHTYYWVWKVKISTQVFLLLRKALYWLNQLPNTQRYNLSKYITDLLTDLHILCTKYE